MLLLSTDYSFCFDLDDFDVPRRAGNMFIAPFDNQHVLALLANGLKRERRFDTLRV